MCNWGRTAITLPSSRLNKSPTFKFMTNLENVSFFKYFTNCLKRLKQKEKTKHLENLFIEFQILPVEVSFFINCIIFFWIKAAKYKITL